MRRSEDVDQRPAGLMAMRRRVMRQRGTEPPFTGVHLDEWRAGLFVCASCGRPLFSSTAKFESGCGWPSFDSPASTDSVALSEDRTHGMVRVEVSCRGCGGHLGHVFGDGPTETGRRFCINSVALDFEQGGEGA